jgi:hypothetical protein
VPAEPARSFVRDLPDHLELHEWRRPVGVVGANFEARPNVVVDIASQLIKSRNAGVLRTGSSAIRSAAVLIDEVVAPAMAGSGLDPAAIQLVRVPGHDTAAALVRQPTLIPLVILRGSGDSTRALAREAALHGVRTLAHADGGAVIYVDQSADAELALQLIERSLDRLGVCNRLNLLLVQRASWDRTVPAVTALADKLGIAVSLPPHAHALGHEWALDTGQEATITVAPAQDATDAANLRPGRVDRGGRCRCGQPVPGHVRGDWRVLERDTAPARWFQAAVAPRDRNQHRRGTRPARSGDVPGPVPASVRGRAARCPLTRVDDQRLAVHRVNTAHDPACRRIRRYLTVQESSAQQERGG